MKNLILSFLAIATLCVVIAVWAGPIGPNAWQARRQQEVSASWARHNAVPVTTPTPTLMHTTPGGDWSMLIVLVFFFAVVLFALWAMRKGDVRYRAELPGGGNIKHDLSEMSWIRARIQGHSEVWRPRVWTLAGVQKQRDAEPAMQAWRLGFLGGAFLAIVIVILVITIF